MGGQAFYRAARRAAVLILVVGLLPSPGLQALDWPVWPDSARHPITANYGIIQQWYLHSGVDFEVPEGTPVYAMESGYVKLERANPDILPASQPSLFHVQGAVWGRIWTCRLFGIPVPKFHNFHLFEIWLKLGFSQKINSFLGTIKRILARKLYKNEY